ncbi:Phospholipase D/nuclease [Glarea lozoyensis ATCC 20868]|uniref:Phospholipase D/nuclease n=1 Tax=Glarea lozoyensis (strain ATCC 20868 / MF5171) TaxID=1116229 RepID=S3DU41_GLAL2|nr:Phospholipase D/nuclease [Glarea lozoyensis ATCC 20868]EPE29923.1 Phospholipase D/nuclease [Glarea lozoyensis ATCC 20868]
MSESDQDDELKRAIALSLQESGVVRDEDVSYEGTRKKNVIDLVSSDEEDDLDAPVVARPVRSLHNPIAKTSRVQDLSIAASKNLEKKALNEERGLEQNDEPAAIEKISTVVQSTAESASGTTLGILGKFDRKKMEEERLERARNRKEQTEGGGSSSEPSRKRKATSPLAEHEARSGKQNVTKSTMPSSSAPRTIGASNPVALSSGFNLNNLPQTQKQQPSESSRISNLNQTPNILSYRNQATNLSELEHAVLSAFQIEPDWIGGKMEERTKVVWVLQAKGEGEKANIRSQAPSNYQFCFPSMEGNINCMHSKLMLLAYKSHLRIVVPSANLVPYDWGEAGGVMENIVFLIDLPRHPGGKSATPETFFATELLHFLKSMGLKKSIIDSLGSFDFSNTTDLAFVHSIGGPHDTNDLKRTGYCGLGNAITRLGIQTDGALTVDLIAASIGSLTLNFIKVMYMACHGDDGMTEYEWRQSKTPKSKPQKKSVAERNISDEIKQYFRIYFPTHETVANSKGGVGAGGTICTQSQWYDNGVFPKELMRDCQSTRPGLLMHSKMIFVRPHKPTKSGVKAWAYVGSANLSESAWGHLSKDRVTKQPKLNCRNWECGVVFPVRGSEIGTKLEHKGPPGIEVFKGHIPVPMIVPGAEYGDKRPWFFKEGR